MSLTHLFRIAQDVTIEKEEGSLLFLKKWSRTDSVPVLPLAAEGVVNRLSDGFVQEDIICEALASILPQHGDAVGHYVLASLRSQGVLDQRVTEADTNLIDLIPCLPQAAKRMEEVARVRLSRYAFLRRDGNRIALESPMSFHKVIILNDTLLWIISELIQGKSGLESENPCFVQVKSYSPEIMKILRACNYLTAQNDEEAEIEEAPPLAMWEFHDLLFHSRSRMGRHRRPLGRTYRFMGSLPPPPLVKPAMSDETISLYKPDLDRLAKTDVPFTSVLESRMSIRDFADTPMTLTELGEFLFRAARIKFVQKEERVGDAAFCPSPGGCAVHELVVYPLVQHCDGLEAGLYRYNSQEHVLEQVTPWTQQMKSMILDVAYAMGKPEIAESIQVLLLITSRIPRIAWGTESIAYAVSLKNLGCLYQTLYLVATAMDLGPCAIGGGDSDLFAEVTGIDYYAESLIGEFVIGKPRQ